MRRICVDEIIQQKIICCQNHWLALSGLNNHLTMFANKKLIFLPPQVFSGFAPPSATFKTKVFPVI